MSFNIIIDKKVVSVNNNLTILQACESANIIVPKFCYHERLSIAGNCRMCLVEIDKAPKLVASCAMPVIQNMVIHTNSLAVKKAREGVLEFLLINHPLDCGICDQAGECDLQEQSKGFGSDRGRFQENKRAVQDFECGPLIKTIMTRCIHCTRCVRFANEIIGLPDLGTSGRGGSLEINLYIQKLFKSEFSGNLIDLCPVGALTSKPYSFTARSWELKSIESIDILDGIGSNIRLDTRGYELMRILPRLNENINEEWISDKTRFAFDGLRQQRLYEPLLKNSNNTFEIVTWKQAINVVVKHLNTLDTAYTFGAIIGPQADCDSISLLNHLIKRYNGDFVDFENVNLKNIDFKSSYLFNSHFKNLEKADACILLGVNPRIEGAILNLRLRKRYLAGNIKIASFGSFFDVSFPIYNLGPNISNFLKFIEGRHSFSKIFSKATQPIVIIGHSFFETFGEKQSQIIISLLAKNQALINNKWCGINVLNSKASDTGKYEIGCKTYSLKNLDLKILYSIGEAKLKKLNATTFVVYQGYQANTTTAFANLILPGKSFTEKISKFINIEGRYQLTKTATSSPTSSKEDWSILYAILEKTNLLPFLKLNIACTSSVTVFNVFDPITFMQKIEMDPIYGLEMEDFFSSTVKVDLNLNNPKLALILLNNFKNLNVKGNFFLQEKTNEKYLKNFSELNIYYPEIYNLNMQFTEIVHDLFKINLSPFIGLWYLSVLQSQFFYYKFSKDNTFLVLLGGMLKNLESSIHDYQEDLINAFRAEKDLTPIVTIDYYLETLDPFTSSYSILILTLGNFFNNLFLSILYPFFMDNYYTVDTEMDTIYQAFIEVFIYMKKELFFEIEELFHFFPELLKQCYSCDNKMFLEECFYSFFYFYRKFFLSNINIYKNINDQLFFVKKVYQAVEATDKKSQLYTKISSENFYDNEQVFYEYYEKSYGYNFFFLPDIWINLINKNSSFFLNELHSFYLGDYTLNKVSYQSFIFKKLHYSKSLKNIALLENKILPSSKFDNFYLMEDFSKFSILMKHCSDVFLERSSFKK